METIDQLQTNLFLGEKWLKQMGEAASRHGINLQYCMGLPRHVLAAVEIPAVTQVPMGLFGSKKLKSDSESFFFDLWQSVHRPLNKTASQ